MVRVLVAGFQHETNSFAATPAGWDAFELGDFFPTYSRGHAMLDRVRYAGLPASGFIDRATAAAWEVVPSCWAGASPSAAVTADAFERIATALRDDVEAALASGRLDGVYLDLHGAAVCEHLDDLETELLRIVRSLAGGEMPIVASLDLHANVDWTMLELADQLVAYRTYPHVDMRETGERAFAMLDLRLRTGVRPAFALARPDFLLPIVSQATLHDPAASIYHLLEDLDTKHGCDASFAPGFPAADVARCGPSIWAYGPDAASVVTRIAGEIDRTRDQWQAHTLEADAAVARACIVATEAERPVLIADVQDNPGAGADGNTTGLLHALVRAGAGHRWPGRIAIGLISDAAAVAHAAQTGVGNTTSLSIGIEVAIFDGGTSDPPIVAEAVVRALSDGVATLRGPMMHGAVVNAGPSACVEIEGILVALCSARTQMLDRALFQMVGIEPERMKIIAVKSAVHFRADFEPIAAECVLAKAPGPMAADPADLPWTRLRNGLSRAV